MISLHEKFNKVSLRMKIPHIFAVVGQNWENKNKS